MRRLLAAFALPFFVPLAACPADPPDDACFEEGDGPAVVTVTLVGDRDDIDDSALTVTLADCLDGQTSGEGAVGDTVTLDAPSTGELTVTVSGTWSNADTAADGGTCTGHATVDPEDGAGEVTVNLTCTITWSD